MLHNVVNHHWVVIFYFYRGHLHHIVKENMLCFVFVLSTYMDKVSLANFGGSHQPTHLGIRTHTSSLRRWEILINDFKLADCKSHHYTLCGLHTLQLGCLPSDVFGCLTSPGWVLVSLSPLQTHALFQIHLWKEHYWCCLNQTVLICTPHNTPYPLSLWCHCLCSKSYKAEHAMLLAFRSRPFYWESGERRAESFSAFLSTSKGTSQLLCQRWALKYVSRVSWTQCSYHCPFKLGTQTCVSMRCTGTQTRQKHAASIRL